MFYHEASKVFDERCSDAGSFPTLTILSDVFVRRRQRIDESRCTAPSGSDLFSGASPIRRESFVYTDEKPGLER